MDAKLLVPDVQLAENKANTLLAKISEIKPTTPEAFNYLGGLLREVKKVVKKLADDFKPATAQTWAAHKTLLDLQKKASGRFEEAEKLAKDKLVSVYTGKEKVEGLSFKEKWTGEVTDPTKIPKEYLVPDYAKLLDITRALKEETNIPGWQVSKKIELSVRE